VIQTALLDLYNFGHFALAEAVARLPSAGLRQSAIRALALTAYSLSHEKRRLIERNVVFAFAGRVEPSETRRIAIGCFREFWQEMVDWVPAIGDRLPAREIEIRGLEHLQQALARSRGAILWESNGFSRRVQAKRTLHAHGVPLHQTHGEAHLGVMLSSPGEGTWLRERLIRPAYQRRESAFVAQTLIIPMKSGIASCRVYAKRLEQNAVLCMAGDGRIARKLYPVQFLGQTVTFAPGAVKLAQLTGAPLLPMFWAPAVDGPPALEIDSPIIPGPAGDAHAEVVNCLQRFADALAVRIMRWPEAYRNWHMVAGRPSIDAGVSSTRMAMTRRGAAQ
jgi:lauroyl/myristoyl acyltransferase